MRICRLHFWSVLAFSAFLMSGGAVTATGKDGPPATVKVGLLLETYDVARWARDEGYQRCSVDFETMNTLAAHFWPRHFRPVCYSLGRVVNEHILDIGVT